MPLKTYAPKSRGNDHAPQPMIRSIDGDVIHDEFRGLTGNEITAQFYPRATDKTRIVFRKIESAGGPAADKINAQSNAQVANYVDAGCQEQICEGYIARIHCGIGYDDAIVAALSNKRSSRA